MCVTHVVVLCASISRCDRLFALFHSSPQNSQHTQLVIGELTTCRPPLMCLFLLLTYRTVVLLALCLVYVSVDAAPLLLGWE